VCDVTREVIGGHRHLIVFRRLATTIDLPVRQGVLPEIMWGESKVPARKGSVLQYRQQFCRQGQDGEISVVLPASFHQIFRQFHIECVAARSASSGECIVLASDNIVSRRVPVSPCASALNFPALQGKRRTPGTARA